jgi:hypothetical protein
MSYCIFTIFPEVKGKTYWGNKTYWRLLQNHYITLSNIVLKNDLIYTLIDSMNRQNIFRLCAKISSFLCSPPIGFYYCKLENEIGPGQWTNRNQEFI